MNRRRLVAAAMTPLMALGLAVVASTPAHAGLIPEKDNAVAHSMSTSSKECTDMGAAAGCVQPYGDILWLKDQRKDGHRVELHWYDGMYGRWGVCYNEEGVDAGWTRCNKDLPEGHEIRWFIYYHNSKGQLVESGEQYTTV